MADGKALEQQMDQEIASGLHELAAAVAQDMATPDQALVSQKQQIQKIEQAILDDLNAMKKIWRDGFTNCVNSLQELAVSDSTIDMESFKSSLQKAFDRVDSVETVQKLGEQLLEGKTWKEVLLLPNATLQLLYKGAKALFDAKRYSDAEAAFSFLAIIDPKQYQFWLGLGHSCFNINQPEKAINAYAMASMLDQSNPWPHIHAANCFEANGDYPHALVALEMAHEVNLNSLQKDHTIEADLTQRINVLKNKA